MRPSCQSEQDLNNTSVENYCPEITELKTRPREGERDPVWGGGMLPGEKSPKWIPLESNCSFWVAWCSLICMQSVIYKRLTWQLSNNKLFYKRHNVTNLLRFQKSYFRTSWLRKRCFAFRSMKSSLRLILRLTEYRQKIKNKKKKFSYIVGYKINQITWLICRLDMSLSYTN